MKKGFLLLVLTLLTVSAVAQVATLSSAGKNGQTAPAELAANACQSTFVSGSGPTYLMFCVTQNGNIAAFEAPQNLKQMYTEGYGICDFTDESDRQDYYDHETTQSWNWAAPVIVQPNGPNTLPLKIVRGTADGNWSLTQTYSFNKVERIVKVVMQLKNTSNITRRTMLTRYADIDANNNTDDRADADASGAWVYYSGGVTYGGGLMLYALPNIDDNGGMLVVPNSASGCIPPNYLVGTYKGDSAAFYVWTPLTVAPNGVKTETFEYRPM